MSSKSPARPLVKQVAPALVARKPSPKRVRRIKSSPHWASSISRRYKKPVVLTALGVFKQGVHRLAGLRRLLRHISRVVPAARKGQAHPPCRAVTSRWQVPCLPCTGCRSARSKEVQHLPQALFAQLCLNGKFCAARRPPAGNSGPGSRRPKNQAPQSCPRVCSCRTGARTPPAQWRRPPAQSGRRQGWPPPFFCPRASSPRWKGVIAGPRLPAVLVLRAFNGLQRNVPVIVDQLRPAAGPARSGTHKGHFAHRVPGHGGKLPDALRSTGCSLNQTRWPLAEIGVRQRDLPHVLHRYVQVRNAPALHARPRPKRRRWNACQHCGSKRSRTLAVPKFEVIPVGGRPPASGRCRGAR